MTASRLVRNGAARRFASAVVMVALVSLAGAACASRTEERPATEPASGDAFADVHGWIAYGDEDGIWAVDPANPGDPISRIQLSVVAADPRAWSSEGSKLLIRNVSPRGNLFVLDAEGSKTRLTDAGANEYITGGSFSPDGSQVVYATSFVGGARSGIFVVSSGGGTPRLVHPATRRHYFPNEGRSFRTAVYDPTFSPDGTQIAYFDGMGDHSHSLWVMNADGSNDRLLVDNEVTSEGHVFGLVWSPDGERLAFNLRRNQGGIYTVRADGTGLTLVAPSGADFFQMPPQWSPDGSRIAFVRDGSLFTIGADGTDEKIVMPDYRADEYPWRMIAWNPVG